MRPTRPFFASLFLLAAVGLSGPVTAQPDKAAALEKAKAKFETESAKAEEALLASLEKALTKAKAAKDKSLTEKLVYEKELFASQRIIPTAVPTATYVRQHGAAQDAIEAAYTGAIKDCLKNKNEAEAESLEKELHALLKASRGYGIAFPDLENKTQVLIESKALGTVLEVVKVGTAEKVLLAPKVGKKRPAQCWIIEREEKGVVFRNATNGRALSTLKSGPDGQLSALKLDPAKETPERVLLKFVEVRREITIASQAAANAEWLLTANEKKLKGVTSYELGFDRAESPVPPAQLWIISEAK